ncbi:MAG TPA: SRPBCC domain-containing protein [Pyrinomonadaceae bacterium]|jgi:uncharacterized protein YndB with AHSA1/START domain|nr:SRPBCC domain-containing protein [Pyrinomonadaceae bacterium]
MATNQSTATAESKGIEIILSREFDAPVDLLWKAWTETEQIEKYWKPGEGFDVEIKENDFRVGGKWLFNMIGPDKQVYPATGIFGEIHSQKKIVTSDEFGDGTSQPEGAPTGVIVTVLFDDLGNNRSKLTLEIKHKSIEDRKKHEEMGVIAGWNTIFDNLAIHLATLQK